RLGRGFWRAVAVVAILGIKKLGSPPTPSCRCAANARFAALNPFSFHLSTCLRVPKRGGFNFCHCTFGPGRGQLARWSSTDRRREIGCHRAFQEACATGGADPVVGNVAAERAGTGFAPLPDVRPERWHVGQRRTLPSGAGRLPLYGR